MQPSSSQPPAGVSLKAWWSNFTSPPKAKKDVEWQKAEEGLRTVFGKSLKESLKYASVQISTANSNGELYVWGFIPVVVAKCGLYLKENATEVQGTFRVNGSNKRMRDLQAVFETPPRYGKSVDWTKENYTTHDVASVFRRYLTQMPEPVIPHDMYHDFRDALAKKPFYQDEVIATYKSLIHAMPRANQYLLLYVLDLLSVFARKSDKNLMTAANLAVIFRPGLISHPNHEMSPPEHQLSQQVLEFLIAHQDWFILDVPPPPLPLLPPPRPDPDSQKPGGSTDPDDFYIIPSSEEEYSQAEGSWSSLRKDKRKLERRKTVEKAVRSQKVSEEGDLTPVEESPSLSTDVPGASGVTRSRTLPSSRDQGTAESSSPERARLLRKQKRASASQAGRSRAVETG